MPFVKIVKNNAYFKRFQTKFRRRREGKTDYYARKRLIIQDKNKYNTPKYRLVARITNQRCIAQIIYATLKGDKVLCSAESYELKQYGLTAGLANYASCYATGLLLARRLLKQLKMDSFYEGNTKVDGEVYDVNENPNSERRPFRCHLDSGLARTSTGARVFAVLKGTADGGLWIQHSNKRFPGFKKTEDGDKYNPKIHRDRIFGAHVDHIMKGVKKDADRYKLQFSQWDSCLKKSGAGTVEKLFTKIHAEIRKNPDRKTRPAKSNFKRDHQKYRCTKLTNAERKERVQKKIQMAMAAQANK